MSVKINPDYEKAKQHLDVIERALSRGTVEDDKPVHQTELVQASTEDDGFDVDVPDTIVE